MDQDSRDTPIDFPHKRKWDWRSSSSVMEGATKRAGHVAVVWKDATIIWGGSNRDTRNYICPSLVYYHIAGEWFMKETTGCLPGDGPYMNVAAQVLDDKLFVFDGGRYDRPNDHTIIHSLDLNSWSWTSYTPSGPPPLRGSSKMSSWVHNGKIYFFGGETTLTHKPKDGPHDYPSYLRVKKYLIHEDEDETLYDNTTNQLFCYNPHNNTWEWPLVRGDIPSPRKEGTAVVNWNFVYFFGGNTPHFTTVREDSYQHAELYTLDMNTMTWQLVHTSKMLVSAFPIMKWRMSQTFTRISRRTAVLFGSSMIIEENPEHPHRRPASENIGYCWLLDLDEALHSYDPSSIWTPVPGYEQFETFMHSSVLEPLSQQLWVIGSFFSEQTKVSGLLKVSLRVKPLKILAMESTVRHVSAKDSRIGSDEIPEKLRKEIEWNREVYENMLPGGKEEA